MKNKTTYYNIEQVCGFYYEYILTVNIFQRLNSSDAKDIFEPPWKAFQFKLDEFIKHISHSPGDDIYHQKVIESEIINHFSSNTNVPAMLETVNHYARSASVSLELNKIPRGAKLELIKTEYAILSVVMGGFEKRFDSSLLLHGNMTQHVYDIFDYQGRQESTAFEKSDFLLAYTYQSTLFLFIYEYKSSNIKTHFAKRYTSTEHFEKMAASINLRTLAPVSNAGLIENTKFIYSTTFNNNKLQTLRYFSSFINTWGRYSHNSPQTNRITYNAKIITNNTYFTWLEDLSSNTAISTNLQPLLNRLKEQKDKRDEMDINSYNKYMFDELIGNIKSIAQKKNIFFSASGTNPYQLHTKPLSIPIPLHNQLNHNLINEHAADLLDALQNHIVTFALGTMGIGKSFTYKKFIASFDSCLSIVSTKLTGINKDYLIHNYDKSVTVINTDSQALEKGIVFTNSLELDGKSFTPDNTTALITFEYVDELTFDEKTNANDNSLVHRVTGTGAIELDQSYNQDEGYLGVNNSLILAAKYINELNTATNICIVTSLAAIEQSSGFSSFLSKLSFDRFEKFTLFIDEFTTASSFTSLYDSILLNVSKDSGLAHKATILFADASITDSKSLMSELANPVHNGNIHTSKSQTTPSLHLIPRESIRCNWQDMHVKLDHFAVVNRNGYPASNIDLKFSYFFETDNVSKKDFKDMQLDFYVETAIAKYIKTKKPVFIYYQDKKFLKKLSEKLTAKLPDILKRPLVESDIMHYNSNSKFDPSKNSEYLFILSTSSGSRGVSFKPVRNYILTINQNINFASELSEILQASCRGRGYDIDISNRNVSVDIVILPNHKHKNNYNNIDDKKFHLPYFASTTLMAYQAFLSRFTDLPPEELQLCTTAPQGIVDLGLLDNSVAQLFSSIFSALRYETAQESVFKNLLTVYSPKPTATGGSRLEELIVQFVKELHDNQIELMESYLDTIHTEYGSEIAFISGYLFCNSVGSISYQKLNDKPETNAILESVAGYLYTRHKEQKESLDANANEDLHKALYTLSKEDNLYYNEKYAKEDNYILMIPIEFRENNIHSAMKLFLEQQLSIPPEHMFPLTDSPISLSSFAHQQPFIVFKGTTIQNIKSIFTQTKHESLEKIFPLF